MVDLSSKERVAVSALVASFLLVGILSFVDPDITGYAVNDQRVSEEGGSSESLGVYSIPASFAVSIDYDLGVYDTVNEGFDTILSCAQEGTPVEVCTQRQDSARLDWELHCQQGAERVFYDVVKLLRTCAELEEEQVGCSCNEPFQSLTLGEGMEAQEAEHLIRFEEREGALFAISADHPDILAASIGPSERYAGFPSTLTLNYEEGTLAQALWEYPEEERREIVAEQRLGVNRQSTSTGPSLVPLGESIEEAGGAMGVRRRAQNIQALNQCQLPPDNIKRFCVTQTDKSVLAYDPLDGEVKDRLVTIRFAAAIPDTPPPALTLLEAKDRPKDEQSVLLTWEESEAQDVAGYEVYASSDLPILEETPTAEFGRTAAVSNGYYDLSSEEELDSMPELDSCELDHREATCLFGHSPTPVSIEQGRLYRIGSSEGLATYLLSFPLGQAGEHSFSIVAVDANNNKLSNEDEQKIPIVGPASAQDDLPPSSAGIVRLTQPTYNPDTTLASVPQEITPTKNPDGTDADDFLGVGVYYLKNPSEEPQDEWALSEFEGPLSVIDLNGNSYGVDLSSTAPQSLDEYYLVFIAEDEAGNPDPEKFKIKELGATVLPPLTISPSS